MMFSYKTLQKFIITVLNENSHTPLCEYTFFATKRIMEMAAKFDLFLIIYFQIESCQEY